VTAVTAVTAPTSPGPVVIGRDEARERATEELLTGGYAQETLPQWFLRQIRQLIGDLFDVAPGGTVGGVIAAIATVVVIAALVGLLLRQIRKAARDRLTVTESVFGGRRRTAAEHRQAAETLAAEGRFAEAIRERLRAIARDLEDRALVEPLPGRTADELAAEAGRALPAFAGELAAAARTFDDVTYGEVPGSREAYETMRSLDERLQTAKPALTASEAGA